jgi:GT2 family glycosyltransferase
MGNVVSVTRRHGFSSFRLSFDPTVPPRRAKMIKAGTTSFHLVPDCGIEISGARTVAAAGPVWLRIEPIGKLAGYKWVRLRYSASFFDDPVRPLIRFVTAAGEIIVLPMNGPVLGSAEWVGRIPDNTVTAAISPVGRPGPFAFRLDGVAAVPRAALVIQGLTNPDWLYWAARSRLLNSRREASQALSFATSTTVCGTSLRDYARWRARLARPLDLAGLDRPRSDWRTGPVFCLILDLRAADPDRLRRTLQSLRAQVYPRWFLHAVVRDTTDASVLSAFHAEAVRDSRFSEIAADGKRQGLLAEKLDRSDFLVPIDAGDSLPDYTLAVVAETLAREPGLELIYSDEERVTPNGRFSILKPDWSPIRQTHLPYLGRLTFIRSRLMSEKLLQTFLGDKEGVVREITKQIPRSTIRHIRRTLCSHSAAPKSHEKQLIPIKPAVEEPTQWPGVTIIVPTRDNADLLAECVAGLREKTDYPWLETIVVDNGSTAPDAVQLLQDIARTPQTTVLQRPGPFNFSALCNAGARATTARVLVFLNNDIALIEPGWLKAMVRYAIKPEIGVVGAKLLFPNGLIQHAGAVVGFGGIAGHIYRGARQNHRGYLNELTVPHEVTAVTGACIAIERTKFEAVGGFDAENLAVDLNDIDLCLRAAERGWTNLWTPEAMLIHHQSATRGIDPDPYVLYRKERSYFVERWAQVIRDDPYFHPALSLYAHNVALA